MARIQKRLALTITAAIVLSFFAGLWWWLRLPFSPEERLESPLHYAIWFRGQPIGRQHEELDRLADGTWQLRQRFHVETSARGSVIRVEESTDMRFAAQAPYPLMSVTWYKSQGDKIERLNLTQDQQRIHGAYWNGSAEIVIDKSALDFSLMDHLRLAQFVREPTDSDTLHWAQIRFPDVTLDVREFRVSQKGSRWWFNPWLFQQKASETSPELSVSVSSNGVLLGMQLGANWTVALAFSTNHWSPEVTAAAQMSRLAPPREQDSYWQASVRSDKSVGAARQVSSLQMRWPQHIALPLSHTAQQFTVPGLISTDIKQASEKASTAEQESGLLPDPRYALDNDKIRRLAEQLTAQVADPEKKVQRLLLFVSEHLKPRDVFVDQNAAEILAAGQGDCTEYAQLFVALARAVDIPAREVSGWVYLGDKAQRFGGHAWAEVVIDGRWISADPMWNLMPVTGTHLRMGDGETGALAIAQAPTNFEFTVERVSYQ